MFCFDWVLCVAWCLVLFVVGVICLHVECCFVMVFIVHTCFVSFMICMFVRGGLTDFVWVFGLCLNLSCNWGLCLCLLILFVCVMVFWISLEGITFWSTIYCLNLFACVLLLVVMLLIICFWSWVVAWLLVISGVCLVLNFVCFDTWLAGLMDWILYECFCFKLCNACCMWSG